MDANVESASILVAPEVAAHPEPRTTPTASIDNPLLNAVGKALHPDVVVFKQEGGWFQAREEKWKRKTAEKIATRQEIERLAKEAEDARNQVVLMKQLLEQQYGIDL